MLTKTEICTRSWDIALTDQTVCFGRTVEQFELLAGKVLECSELMGLFCRNLGRQCWEHSRQWRAGLRSFRAKFLKSLKDSIRVTHLILKKKTLKWNLALLAQMIGCWPFEVAEAAVIKKRRASLRWNLLESASCGSEHRSCSPESTMVWPGTGSETWEWVGISQVALVFTTWRHHREQLRLGPVRGWKRPLVNVYLQLK